MKIRRAKKSDRKELISLYEIFTERSVRDSFLKVLKERNSFIYVAEEKNKLIGFITFSARYVTRYPKPITQVEELFVLKNYRKMGVGKQLIAAAEKQAKKLNCYRIYIESAFEHKNAHQFYKKFGYEQLGYYFQKNLN